MKLLPCVTLFTLLFISAFAYAQDQRTEIPDANFRAVLLEEYGISADSDNTILNRDAEAVVSLNVASRDIGNLSGIEAFTALTSLNCFNNELTSLDLSSNTALTDLNCNSNSLASLDVSSNTALTDLSCGNNQLTNLDVSANTELTRLFCASNQLTSLNIANGNNTSLFFFNVSNNPNLSCIQVDGVSNANAPGWTKDATAVYREDCSTTAIPDDNFEQALIDLGIDTNGKNNTILNSEAEAVVSLNVSNFPNFPTNVKSRGDIENLSGIEAFTALTSLNCNDNSLTSLDLSANTVLTRVFYYINQLGSLNIATGNNTSLFKMNARINPNLTCIQVDDAGNVPGDWDKDATSVYREECSTTAIPDDNFEQALIDLGIDTNGKNNSILNYVAEAVVSLDVASRGIGNLSGIEAFTSLTSLDCFFNQLTSLDVSANTELTRLFCTNNQLTSLNIQNENNTSLLLMNATRNPNLTCIQVDDAGNVPGGWSKDATSVYSSVQEQALLIKILQA